MKWVSWFGRTSCLGVAWCVSVWLAPCCAEMKYPSYPKLNELVKAEAEQHVERLRDHPSVVIFAGNNEDYQIAEAFNVIDYSDESGDYMKGKFPASVALWHLGGRLIRSRHIYEILLPEVVKRCSNVFYWRSSPYGGKDSRDKTIGDIHQWNVWHGTQEPWHNWDQLGGRFISSVTYFPVSTHR